MKPYRGTLLAAAVLFAALPLSGCGDSDNWKTSGDVTLKTSTATVQVSDKAIFTVQSVPPGPDYTCDTDIEYRAQGAGLNVSWANVPGIDTTRVFELRPTQTSTAGSTLSVVARARCLESREDWKYSNQVDVAVTQKVLPVVTAVTLTANGTTWVQGDSTTGDDIVYFTISISKDSNCTLNISNVRFLATGPGMPVGPVEPPALTFGLEPSLVTDTTNMTVVASAWCSENPSAIVSSDSVSVEVRL